MKSLALGTEEDVDDSDASYFVCGAHASEEQAELGTHLPDALAAPLAARMTKPKN